MERDIYMYPIIDLEMAEELDYSYREMAIATPLVEVVQLTPTVYYMIHEEDTIVLFYNYMVSQVFYCHSHDGEVVYEIQKYVTRETVTETLLNLAKKGYRVIIDGEDY